MTHLLNSFEQKMMNPQLWHSSALNMQNNSDVTQYINNCLHLENNSTSTNQVLQFWLAGLEKFSHSPIFLENLATYFYRNKKYHRALEFCKKVTDLNNSLEARKTAIAAAFAMGQYHLVWDNFIAIEELKRPNLENDLLSRCARAALELKKFAEAEQILCWLAKRQGIPPLPDLKTSLLSEFGNEKNLQLFLQETAVAFSKAKKITEISLRNCILYAVILMHYEKYEEALSLLEKYRLEYLKTLSSNTSN